MTIPTSIFTIRLSDEDRQALNRIAEADDRTVSALVRKIIRDWLRRNTREQRR